VLEELTLHCSNNFTRDAGRSWGSIRRARMDRLDVDTASWRTVLPFLRDNKTLKSFTFHIDKRIQDPSVTTLCSDTVAMLEGNSSLEYLGIQNSAISSDAASFSY
jgi:hypothetical protein